MPALVVPDGTDWVGLPASSPSPSTRGQALSALASPPYSSVVRGADLAGVLEPIAVVVANALIVPPTQAHLVLTPSAFRSSNFMPNFVEIRQLPKLVVRTDSQVGEVHRRDVAGVRPVAPAV